MCKKNANGHVVYDPNTISQKCHDYFAKLYSLPNEKPDDLSSPRNMVRQFLFSYDLSPLPHEALDSLNAPITPTDIQDVLSALPSSKSPGPNGLHYLYSKMSSSQLPPNMATLYDLFLEDI